MAVALANKLARMGCMFLRQFPFLKTASNSGLSDGGLNLETSVGSRKSAQALGAPSKAEKYLITNKVTTNFYASLCTPISYASFSRPTEVSRLKVACF